MEALIIISTIIIMVGIFPTELASFNTYVEQALPYLVSNKARLHVATDDATLLGTLLTDWQGLWAKYNDPDKNTKDVLDDLHQKHDEIVTNLERIYADIPESVLNTQDRNTLNLHERDKTRTRTPVMDHAPKMTIANIQHFEHVLRIVDGDNPTSQKMPRGQVVILEFFVGAANLAPDQINWSGTKVVRHFLYHVAFTDADVSKVAYYRCCFENAHGERSLWSATLSAAVA